MKYTVDRFEGSIAILERETDCKMVEIERCLLPTGLQEGDFLTEDKGVYTVLVDETKAREEHIKKLMNDLFEE